MQRLTTIDYINGFQQTKQYGYDALSNILDIQSITSTSPSTGVLGGPVNHSYTYDDYNRLIHAQGNYVGPNDHMPEMLRQEYSLEMLYDESHSILTKSQNHRMDRVTSLTTPLTNSASYAPTAYHLEYEDYNRGQFSTDGYSYTQPHAPRAITQYPIDSPDNPNDPRVEKQLLDYDTRGNLTHIEREINNPELPMDTSRESVQKLVWDEEDRLLGVDLRTESDRGQPHIAAYTYDAGGERGIRYVPRQQEGVSSGTTAGYAQDMDIMLYPNALITVRPQELPEDFEIGEMHPSFTFTTYTKHYYLGSERINSKLGTVKDLGVLCEQMGGNDLIEEMNRRVEEADERLEDLHTDLDKDIRLNSPYLYSREHQFVCDFKSHNPKMYDAYWYHPDHLGSSSFITNTTGEISQHMEYLPFGETLVEEHLNSYNSPFKFNGKEYDAETGNYYYGARYLNPKWSMWLGVDPLAEKFPDWNPYNYTLQNPINLVDPDGMAPDDWIRKSKSDRWTWNESIQSEAQAKAVGLQYGGKTTNEVINRWGNKGILSSRWLLGHGQEFDYGSRIEPVVSPKITEGVQNQREKYDDSTNANLFIQSIDIDIQDVPVGAGISRQVKFEGTFTLDDKEVNYIGHYFTRNHDVRNFNKLTDKGLFAKDYFNPNNYQNSILFTKGNDRTPPVLIIEIPDNESYNHVRSKMTGYNYNEN